MPQVLKSGIKQGVKTGAKVGAGYGAAYGASSAMANNASAKDIAKSAAISGAIGAGSGIALGVAPPLIGAGGRQAVRGAQAFNRMNQQTALRAGVSPEAGFARLPISAREPRFDSQHGHKVAYFSKVAESVKNKGGEARIGYLSPDDDVVINQSTFNKWANQNREIPTTRLVHAANQRDNIVQIGGNPNHINTITNMGDGKTMVLAMEKRNGHYVVTAIDTKKTNYVNSILRRGNVLDTRGGTPYSPSATSPLGTARQPERLSGVTSTPNIPKTGANVNPTPRLKPTPTATDRTIPPLSQGTPQSPVSASRFGSPNGVSLPNNTLIRVKGAISDAGYLKRYGKPRGGTPIKVKPFTADNLEFSSWKDKPALGLQRETLERNLDRVAGADAPKVKQFLVDASRKNETNRTVFLNNERKMTRDYVVKRLGIKPKSQESALVQQFGEGIIDEAQLR